MRKIATLTFKVEVSVPDDYSEQTIASLQSCIRSYDLRGTLYEAVMFRALMAPVNQPSPYSVDVRLIPDFTEGAWRHMARAGLPTQEAVDQ